MNPTQKISKIPSRSFAGSVLCATLFVLSNGAFAQTAAPAPATDEVVKLSPFTVSTERDYGYRASNSVSATRTNTPIKDVPVNIQVLGKELYEDLLINSQVDLERYNSSLVNGGSDSFSDNAIQQQYGQLVFRGFTQYWGLRDGVREYDPVDTQGLARIEIIKGPVAALYGLSYPGGVMNSINKTVDYTHNFSNVRVTARSEGGYRASLDSNFTGTIAGGKAGLRFNAVNEKTEDQRAHSEGKIRFYQLAGSWKPLPNTELNLTVESSYRGKPNGLNSYAFQRGTTTGDLASVPMQILRPEIPWDWNWSNGQNLRSNDVKFYKGSFTQQVGDNFSLTGYIQYNTHEQIDGNGWDQAGSSGADSWEVAGRGWFTDSTGDHIESGYSYRDWTNSVHAYGATGVYKFDFTGMKNTFTFGGASWAEKFLSHRSQSAATIMHTFAANSPIDIPYGPPADLHTDPVGGYGHENNTNYYYFGALNSSFFDDRLKTNIAINRTTILNKAWNSGVSAFPESGADVSKTSPMFGVVYAVTKSVNVFAVRGTSIFPTSLKNSFGVAMPPNVGESIEGGVKFETEDGKFSGTVSYYTIDQTGGGQNDPSVDNNNTAPWLALTALGTPAAIAERDSKYGNVRPHGDTVPGGKSNSKGFEVDINYQPTRNWTIALSYGNNTNKVVTAVNPDIIGRASPNSVKSQFSLLTKYTLTEGAAKGLSFGMGLAAAGKSHYNDGNGNSYFLDASTGKWVGRMNPSTLNLDTFATYRFTAFGRNQSVQLNIKNLTEQGEYVGWKPTGTNKLATERYEVPVKRRFEITYSIDL